MSAGVCGATIALSIGDALSRDRQVGTSARLPERTVTLYST